MDLTYDVPVEVPAPLERGDVAYVVFDNTRPANGLRVTASRPTSASGETCIRGEVISSDRVTFPGSSDFSGQGGVE